jgi:purine-binding chemotaxis protein CheW
MHGVLSRVLPRAGRRQPNKSGKHLHQHGNAARKRKIERIFSGPVPQCFSVQEVSMQSAVLHADMLQLVTFKLDGQKYAVDILKVQEINNMKEITSIPNAPAYLEGAINLRGKVIPVLNLRKKFGFEENANSELRKIVIMDVRGVIMGLIVDAVSDVLRVNRDVVEPPPPVSSNVSSEFISGIAKLPEGLVILLDMDRLLDAEEHKTVFGEAPVS